ncbi:MAG: hypothetical protein U0232_03270 [Thermomicrobiales bacterium]
MQGSTRLDPADRGDRGRRRRAIAIRALMGPGMRAFGPLPHNWCATGRASTLGGIAAPSARDGSALALDRDATFGISMRWSGDRVGR